MANPEIPKDIQAMSFEDALDELQRIVTELEAGKGKLDEAIDAYQRGAALKRHCESKLAEAKAKVEKIKLDADGNATAVPADEIFD